jgi:anthranilate/para-aminobenzoate synthase component II
VKKFLFTETTKSVLISIKELNPAAILISPGPCTPVEAGISVDLIKELGCRIPVLGVCLGHQSIGFAFNGNVIRAPYLMHGKVSQIYHKGRIFSKDFLCHSLQPVIIV